MMGLCFERKLTVEKTVFKIKKYEFKIDDAKIEILKNGKLIAQPLISDFRVLHYKGLSEKKATGEFIFISPTIVASILIQYRDIESDRTIKLLLEKISSRCVMDLRGYWSASFYQHPKQKKLSFWKKMNVTKKNETKCTCAMCSNVWYVSEDKLNKAEGNKLMAAGNLLSGNMMAASYNANNIGNPFDCPKCGSSRIKKENIVFYVDKNGNHVNL